MKKPQTVGRGRRTPPSWENQEGTSAFAKPPARQGDPAFSGRHLSLASSRWLFPRHRRGFTLLELLVVVGLIAALASVLVSGLAGAGQTHALQSAQATVANLVTAARLKAPATNRKTRLLVNVDPGTPERYLRLVVLQLARQPGSSPEDWDTIQSVFLPAHTYVVPGSLTGLVSDSTQWKRVSDPTQDLASDLFKNQSLSLALEGEATAQTWTGLAFTPNGTLAALSTGPPPKGSVVLALGQARPPGSFAAGEAPLQLVNAPAVRGLVLSAYGVPALLNERTAF